LEEREEDASRESPGQVLEHAVGSGA